MTCRREIPPGAPARSLDRSPALVRDARPKPPRLSTGPLMRLTPLEVPSVPGLDRDPGTGCPKDPRGMPSLPGRSIPEARRQFLPLRRMRGAAPSHLSLAYIPGEGGEVRDTRQGDRGRFACHLPAVMEQTSRLGDPSCSSMRTLRMKNARPGAGDGRMTR